MTKHKNLKAIRTEFLSYFEEQDHRVVASAPLVPQDDPSLLFVNAGMVPFKNYFTGAATPKFTTAVSSQKCVRAGGKHNDLENVGYTARHHTFFEMLGNFSFGDYFKEQAIFHAWEFVTKRLGLPKDRLLVTTYADDDEGKLLWQKIAGLTSEKIIPIATSDNFWSMGPTGPCGPCSEIFFDHGSAIQGGPPGSPDEDGDRFIEIWNLVFMQFNQKADGTRDNLPAPSIDTGMGLERICAILQDVHSNYETDLFVDLMDRAESHFSILKNENNEASFRVIADHIRSMNFLLSDGVTPSNEGRGYVLRRIMRRAMRHAHKLGSREACLYRLTNDLVDLMGEAYPELKRASSSNEKTIFMEEERFLRTLDTGMSLLDSERKTLEKGSALSGKVAFKLYDTYGFPLDLTKDILRSDDIRVDDSEFEEQMAAQKNRARANWSGSGGSANEQIWIDLEEKLGPTDFVGYDHLNYESQIVQLFDDAFKLSDQLVKDQSGWALLESTPFYAESGGQAGDHGVFVNVTKNEPVAQIVDVQKKLGFHLHNIQVIANEIDVKDKVGAIVDKNWREKTKANHSAAHLVHEALRRVLGTHVSQKGQFVDQDRMRFDFSHFQAVSEQELIAIEEMVNQVIRDNAETKTDLSSPEEALKSGAIALFGEKYDDEVRVLSIGRDPETNDDKKYSIELCGGTHVRRTGEIGLFVIVNESAVASGIRRIEAYTGDAALKWSRAKRSQLDRIAASLKASWEDSHTKVDELQTNRKEQEREIKMLKQKLLTGASSGSSSCEKEKIGDIEFIYCQLENVSGKELRNFIDQEKKMTQNGVILFFAIDGEKIAAGVGVTPVLSETLNAIDLVKLVSAKLGGKGGGGRPDLAIAGGQDKNGISAAIEAVKQELERN